MQDFIVHYVCLLRFNGDAIQIIKKTCQVVKVNVSQLKQGCRTSVVDNDVFGIIHQEANIIKLKSIHTTKRL